MYDGSIIIGTEVDTKDFKSQIQKIEDDLDKYEQELNAISSAKPYDKQIEDIKEYSAKIEKLSNQLVDLRKKQANIEKSDLDRVQKSIGKISNEVSGVIKKMGKWALAIFAVESAYGFVRSSINKVSQYNEQVANDIEYISFSIATALEPVIVTIVGLIKKLLGLINALSIRLVGVDIFSRATAENFNKAQKNANKLKKSLAGFDTANVLSDSTSTQSNLGQTQIIDWNEETAQMDSWLDTSSKKIANWCTNLIIKWNNLESDIEKALINPEVFTQAMGYWDMFGLGVTQTFYGILETIEGNLQSILGIFQILTGALLGNTNMIEEGWKNLVNGIKKMLNGLVIIIVGIFTMVGGIIKGIVNEILSGIKGMLNIVIGGINTLINGINSISVKNPFTGESWSPSIPKIPTFKMKTGGIINAPNKGVPVASNVVGGEAGKEGILPLTNEQTMAELGMEIGKHVVINLDLTNKIDGRVLSRILEKIKNDDTFARNGG